MREVVVCIKLSYIDTSHKSSKYTGLYSKERRLKWVL